MTRDDQIQYVKANLNKMSIRQMAKHLGVHHTTINYWIKNDYKSDTRNSNTTPEEMINRCRLYPIEYLYVLGLYLSDGHINHTGKTYRLRISKGINHQDVIQRAIKSLRTLFPDNKVAAYPQKSKCVVITTHSNSLIYIFPQSGEGKKHDRDVSLLSWQMDLVDHHLDAMLLGLHDGDGSEYLQTNMDNTTYYNFTNKSSDIINLYKYCCEKLGIEIKQQMKSGQAGTSVLTCRKKQFRELFEQTLTPIIIKLDTLSD